MAKAPTNVLAVPAPVYDEPVIWEGDVELPLYRVLNQYHNKAMRLFDKAGALYKKNTKHPKVPGILAAANQYLLFARRVAKLVYKTPAIAEGAVAVLQIEAAGVPAVSLG